MLLPTVKLAPAPFVLFVWRTTVNVLAVTLVTAIVSYTLAVLVNAIT